MDSGTSFTYVSEVMFGRLLSEIHKYCTREGKCDGTAAVKSGESLCYRLSSPAALSTFPNVVISLAGGAELTIGPERVFINMEWDDGLYCLGILNSGDESVVLGATAMMGHDVIFDVANRRVGIAAATAACGGRSSSHSDLPKGGVGAATVPPTPSPPRPDGQTGVVATLSVLLAITSTVALVLGVRECRRRGSHVELVDSPSPVSPRTTRRAGALREVGIEARVVLVHLVGGYSECLWCDPLCVHAVAAQTYRDVARPQSRQDSTADDLVSGSIGIDADSMEDDDDDGEDDDIELAVATVDASRRDAHAEVEPLSRRV